MSGTARGLKGRGSGTVSVKGIRSCSVSGELSHLSSSSSSWTWDAWSSFETWSFHSNIPAFPFNVDAILAECAMRASSGCLSTTLPSSSHIWTLSTLVPMTGCQNQRFIGSKRLFSNFFLILTLLLALLCWCWCFCRGWIICCQQKDSKRLFLSLLSCYCFVGVDVFVENCWIICCQQKAVESGACEAEVEERL